MKLKYVGDNIVLLHGISKDMVMEELKSEEDGLLSIFHLCTSGIRKVFW